MNKKTVLCDADDVIENLLECWIRRINVKHGTNVGINDITEWGLSKFFPHISDKEVYAPLYDKELWTEIERIPGCYNVLENINKYYELYIVTASSYHTLDVKIPKILMLYPFLNESQFIITHKKQLVRGDYLIDNGEHNLIGGTYQGILYNYAHNKNFDNEKYNIIRVNNWNEIAEILL